jgi:heat shock protein HslJ/uncharacterized lipoprotein YbaY
MKTTILMALLAASLVAAAAEAREITGTATYRERIALDPDAVLVVEVRGPDGRIAAEARIETAGRQVPIPFAIDVPGADAAQLRAGLFLGGRPLFVSDPVDVSGDNAAGEVLLRPAEAMGFASSFRCGDRTVTAGFVGDGMRLRIGDRIWTLAPDPAASGARFSGEGATFWSRGNAATVTVGDETLPECAPAIPPRFFPFTAHGNEPFWTLTLADGRATYAPLDGAGSEDALPEPDLLPDGFRFALPSGLVVTVTEAIHRDTMTGMPYPFTVTLARDKTTLTGGGGDPRALLEGPEWRAVSIGGESLPAEAEVTLLFLPGDRIAGKSACNRYMGGYTLWGEGFGFSELGGTMMACPDARMALERRWLDTLATVSRFDIAEDGALVLYAGDTEAARLTR